MASIITVKGYKLTDVAPGTAGDALNANFIKLGNDLQTITADILARLVAANNLSDLVNAAAARANLGNVQTDTEVAATIAAAGHLLASNNLSDLTSAVVARTNLGNVLTSAEISALIAAAGHLLASNNLSDLSNPTTARTNLDVIQRVAGATVGNVPVLTADGQLSDSGSPPGGGGGATTFKHTPECWYGPIPEGPFNSIKGGFPDEINLVPVEIPETGFYKAMGIHATTTGGSIRLGVYDSADNGLPKNKLIDLGTKVVVSGGIGDFITVTPFQLLAGFVYLAVIFSAFPVVTTVERVPGSNPGAGSWESLVGRFQLTTSFQMGLFTFGSFTSGLPTDISSLTIGRIAGVTMVNIQKA